MSWSNALPTVSSFPTRRSSDLRSGPEVVAHDTQVHAVRHAGLRLLGLNTFADGDHQIGSLTVDGPASVLAQDDRGDRKSTRLNSSHVAISYAVFCLKKKTEFNV